MYSNIFSSEIRQQNRTEQNRTEQNRTEQNRTLTGLPSVAEQNPYRASFGRRTERVSLSKSNKADCRTDIFRISLPTSAEQLQDLFRLQNRIITKLISIAKENLAKFISVV